MAGHGKGLPGQEEGSRWQMYYLIAIMLLISFPKFFLVILAVLSFLVSGH
jgi:hypothetical protein